MAPRNSAAAKAEMMTIAFSHAGIIPAEITGGKAVNVAAHAHVEVPRSYGEQLVTDRFAYVPEMQMSEAQPADVTRAELEKELAGRREALVKETDAAKKATQTAKIADLETQLAALPS